MDIKESKVEVLKRHRANLARRHEEELADFDEAFEMVRAELAEAEKPELRHGDVYVSGTFVAVVLCCGGNWTATHKDGSVYRGTEEKIEGHVEGFTFSGNIFAELEALSEDVEEFKTVSPAATETTYRIDGDGDLAIDLNGNPQLTVVQKCDLAELILKLRQMAATAKRKE